MKGAFLLTIGAIITKILSAVYRVPFQNIVGDTGFYIYQQVYPFYGIALALSTTGFPLVISKIYAELKHNKERMTPELFMKVAIFFMVALGIILFSIVFFSSDVIAIWMNDENLSPLIKVSSFSFLIVPFTALLRGYFQGEGNMTPTAISQIGEQMIRVFTILVGSIFLIKFGYDLYVVGAGAIFGSITGGLVSFAILFLYLWRMKGKIKKEKGSNIYWNDIWTMVKKLFIQGSTICIAGMLLLFLQLGDALNLYRLLYENGVGEEIAKGMKGVYDRGQPLIQLGTVVATSMSLSLVPIIASERFKQSKKDLYQIIQLAIQVSIVVGFGGTVGLIGIMKPTNMMLFENDAGTSVLSVLVFTICLSSVIMTIIAIFQGLGFTILPAVLVLIGFILKLIFNEIFVQAFGMMGAAFASNMALLFILFILVLFLKRILPIHFITVSFFVKVCLSLVLMFLSLKGWLFFSMVMIPEMPIRMMATIQALTATAFGGIVYLFAIMKFKLFTEEQLALLPFGNKLLYFLSNK